MGLKETLSIIFLEMIIILPLVSMGANGFYLDSIVLHLDNLVTILPGLLGMITAIFAYLKQKSESRKAQAKAVESEHYVDGKLYDQDAVISDLKRQVEILHSDIDTLTTAIKTKRLL